MTGASVVPDRRRSRLLFAAAASLWASGSVPALAQAPAEEAPPPVAAPASPTVRGLSWDVLGGGVPISGALVQAELGFSGLPSVAYHHSLRRGFSIGGLVGFDFAHFQPQNDFLEYLILAVPVRYTLVHDSDWSVGVRAQPGLQLGFDNGNSVGIAIGAAVNALYTIEHRFILGAGIEVPLLLEIPTGSGRSTRFVAPILAGPVAEFHLSPPLGLTLDAKFGPHFSTNAGTRFGLKLMLGAVYRI